MCDEDVCIKVVAAYEYHNACGVSKKACAGESITKSCDDNSLVKEDMHTDYQLQPRVPCGDDACCGGSDSQHEGCHTKETTEKSCGKNLIEEAKRSNVSAQKCIKSPFDEICCASAKCSVKNQPDELSNDRSFSFDNVALQASGDQDCVHREPKFDIRSICCTDSTDNDNKMRDTEKPGYMCRDTCHTSNEEPLGLQSSTFGKVKGNDCYNSSRKISVTARSFAHIAPIGQVHDRVVGPTGQKAHIPRNRSSDIEKGHSNDTIRVAVAIAGMTCTSCSKKGLNVFKRMTGITNPNINFVAGTGEFDLDSRSDPMHVISQFERETGFKCSRVMKDFQTLDILMSEIEAKQLEDQSLAGVHSVSKVQKNAYTVSFDPTLIGARSLLAVIPTESLASPRNDSTLDSGKKRLLQTAWNTAFAAAFTIPVVVLAWSNNSIPYSKRSIVSLVLATLVQAIAVPEFYVGALKSLVFSRVVEMDMLVVISITAAYVYSVIAFALTHRGFVLDQAEFFETSTLLVTLILVGRLISAVARLKAISAVSMKSLQAEKALLVNNSGGSSSLDTRLLEYDDTILVPPHSRIATDGEIISGSGTIDESMITGESSPISKNHGDTVIAGTMNGSSPLTIRLTRLPGQNSITDIANLVESALGAKPRVQDLADKVAGWFVPVVVCLSMVVFALWTVFAFEIRNKNAGGSFGLAITYSIAVLAVSCPCALGIAVPMVLIIAGGVAAKSGIVIKQASATERAYRTTDVVFDKTGTLTTGMLKVIEKQYYETSLQLSAVKSLIFALLKDNGHPVSSAVTSWLQNEVATTICLKDIQSIPGAGVKATWNGQDVKAGNPGWLNIDADPEVLELMERGMTILGVSIHSELIAVYGLKSMLRDEATAVVQDLHRRKVTCHIVSGDGSKVVEDVAQIVGIEQHNVASRQTPSSKKEYVKMLMDQGKIVLFCGDGTNDAVAVAQAHTGVQIGSTSDITRATADVVLMGGLDGIPTLLDISRQAHVRIVFNFVWSGIYNLFAILLAAGAFVRVRIAPAYAGLGEIVSVLPVILVTMTLQSFKWKASTVNLKTRLQR